jgi:glycosyltransferase involved in cell wall biosynthesis
LKILFVDASRNGWGTERHLVSLAGALARNGHAVVAVVKRGSLVADMLSDRGIRTYASAFRGGADPRGILTMIQAIRRESPDWIVTNRSKLYWTVWVVGRLTGVRIAVFRHMSDLRRWWTRRLLPRLVDRFFVVSEFARDRLVASGTPQGRIDVLFNPIDIERLRSAPSQREKTRLQLGIGPDDFVVGFVGRIERKKGVQILWRAIAPLMSQSPDMRILCIGDGPELDRWRSDASRTPQGARCHFVGWTENMEAFYPAMDLLVAPSLVPETFCRVIAEAQASGVAVVGAEIGGIPEAFAPGFSGLLIAPNNYRQLRSAISNMHADPALRNRFASIGRRYASHRFDAGLIAAQFVTALDSRRPAPPLAAGTTARPA